MMRGPRARLLLPVLALALAPAACLGDANFRCDRHEQCGGGAGAFCETDGHCSISDDHCPSARRYVPEAGPVAGQCVGASCPANPIRAVTAGGDHGCLLRADDGVFCWGRNDHGQLGDGTRTPRSQAVRVPGLAAKAIAAGARHTCAVQAGDGAVLCWGAGDAGQLGDGGGVDRRTPLPVAGVAGAIDVAAGADFSCAALSDGTVRCWGDHAHGQLGDGSPPAAGGRPPVAVFALSGVRALSAHAQHACALRDDETLWCWGSNSQGQLGDGTSGTDEPQPAHVQQIESVTHVTTGLVHTCATTRADGLFCWGNNSSGQLGQSDPAAESRPVSVADIADPIAVAAGDAHTCAVRLSGKTFCWGNNNSGQLGDGTTTALPIPGQVSGLGPGAAVAAGGSFSCALTRDGAVLCWGDDHYGQLGGGSEVFRPRAAPVAAIGGATAVAAGGAHTCAAAVDPGSAQPGVLCWGADQAGQLGDNRTSDRSTPVVTRRAIDQPAAIAAGGTHTCARTAAGALYCWGRGNDGQLGLGPTRKVDNSVPTMVLGPESRVASVAAGDAHTCVALTDGSAACWGAGADGQLGDGASIERDAPTTVGTLDGVSTAARVAEVTAGAAHTCARLTDGTLRCWGRGGDGQLGDGARATSATPVLPSLGVRPAGAAAGAAHTCVFTEAGEVWCWGRGTEGQLGGAMQAVLTPSLVPDVAGARAVAAGAAHTCAVTTAHTVICWGANDQGQLGGGDTSVGRTHVEVLGLTGAVNVSAGAAHTCALRDDGTVWCWGSNTAGQLGDGAVLSRSQPLLARLACE